jgi:NAD(P)-dependent dehydrogenase (short-subunit alcohol dehydrogenase family)
MLLKSRGSIVNVSSVHAIATSEGIAAYAASKGAIVALTRALALEFGRNKVRVNAVLPGAVDTPMLRAGLTRGHLKGKNASQLIRALGSKHVMGQVGAPEEIAEGILFLADPARSSFMTGQSLVIDGGATARLSTE